VVGLARHECRTGGGEQLQRADAVTHDDPQRPGRVLDRDAEGVELQRAGLPARLGLALREERDLLAVDGGSRSTSEPSARRTWIGLKAVSWPGAEGSESSRCSEAGSTGKVNCSTMAALRGTSGTCGVTGSRICAKLMGVRVPRSTPGVSGLG
jgi:hypothetical protein